MRFRTHPIQIALIASPILLLAALVVGLLSAQAEASAMSISSVSLQALAFIVTAIAGLGGIRSNQWFLSPRELRTKPQFYPREWAARIAITVFVLSLIGAGIVFEHLGSPQTDPSTTLFQRIQELDSTFNLLIAALFVTVLYSTIIAGWSGDRALRGEPGMGWFDLFLPRSIITERFEYYQTWVNRPDPSEAEASPRDPDEAL